MSEPRKHHYIPVFYLKQWAGMDRQVCEYRLVQPGKIVTRRKFPNGTGYKHDLYRVDGVPDPIAQAVEREFMRMVDTQANYALQKLIRGDSAPWDSKERSSWTRFLLSLRFRNPETVLTIKRQMVDVWEATLEDMKINYHKVRYVGDPPTFEEFVARTEAAAPYKAALRLLQEIIDNPRVGPSIFGMRWSCASLTASRISLLTSDRPLDMPHGLSDRGAYIALPIGPKRLFIAAHDDAYAKRVASADPTEVVKAVNQAVVHQAREFVWGLDDSQRRFVSNRISRVPDRPIITDVQKQQAIDAALSVSPSTVC
ncbi:MAG: DUF4238 domain-containing protein [Acetobacteraceae bacterium]